jgi:hypothetical protein
MNRSDWLLLLVCRQSLAVDGPDALDPVRIQKGMFLLSQRGPARNLYQFSAYNWGPFSSQIYRDLDYLVDSGLLDRTPAPGQTWARYAATKRGVDRATEIASQVGPADVAWLAQCRRFLTERSFAKLLTDIYAAYPGMATKSQFQS